MKLYFLGTCSGTEPMAGRHHTSVAIELNGQVLWLDAGESCSYTGYLMRLDLFKVRHILISHPHMDHVGGLGNLLWTIRKLRYRDPDLKGLDPITVHVSNPGTFDGTMMILSETEGRFNCDFEINRDVFSDGVVIDEPGLKVTAMHNNHLKKQEGQPWQSYSFLIEAEGKKIVYSGDVAKPAELDCWADCDLMLIETGHHQPRDVAEHFASLEKRPKELIYYHHGRTILADPVGQQKLVREIYGDNALISYDTMTYVL